MIATRTEPCTRRTQKARIAAELMSDTVPYAASDRLAALIRRQVGWQVDDLHVQVSEGGLVLSGHAYTALARVLAEVEAARLGGLPVAENRIGVN